MIADPLNQTQLAKEIAIKLCAEIKFNAPFKELELVDLCIQQVLNGEVVKKAAAEWFNTYKPQWDRFDEWEQSQPVEDATQKRSRKISEAQKEVKRFNQMAELFIHRHAMIFYEKKNLADKSASFFQRRPYKMFNAVKDSRTPIDCLQMDGTIYPHDDKFWDAYPIPCERLFCRCTFMYLNKQEAEQALSNKQQGNS